MKSGNYRKIRLDYSISLRERSEEAVLLYLRSDTFVAWILGNK